MAEVLQESTQTAENEASGALHICLFLCITAE